MVFKKKKYSNSLIGLLLMTLISSCKLDEELSYIMYANNTEDTIIVFASPTLDTTLIYSGIVYGCTEVLPKNSASSPYIQESVKNNIKFYFVKHPLSNYLEHNNKKLEILCWYELSVTNLNDIKYTIPYPPTPSMQNMKMYPSYEEIINREQK